MFTGIVEETGTVEKIQHGAKSILLTVRAKIFRARFENRRQSGGERLLSDGDENFFARKIQTWFNLICWRKRGGGRIFNFSKSVRW
jgi:hypothetical protein